MCELGGARPRGSPAWEHPSGNESPMSRRREGSAWRHPRSWQHHCTPVVDTPAIPAPQGGACGNNVLCLEPATPVSAHLSAWAGHPAHPSRIPADSVPVPFGCTWPCCVSRCPPVHAEPDLAVGCLWLQPCIQGSSQTTEAAGLPCANSGHLCAENSLAAPTHRARPGRHRNWGGTGVARERATS